MVRVRVAGVRPGLGYGGHDAGQPGWSQAVVVLVVVVNGRVGELRLGIYMW